MTNKEQGTTMPTEDSTTPSGTTPESGTGQTPPETSKSTSTPGATGDKGGHDAWKMEDLPEGAQQHIRALRKENETRRKAEADAAQAAQAAAEERLAEEKRWQELAEKRGADLAAAREKADAYDRLQAQILERLKAETEQWPEDIRALAPDESDAAAFMAWADKARVVVGKLNEKVPPPGNPTNPKGAGRTQAVEKQIADEARAYVRTRF